MAEVGRNLSKVTQLIRGEPTLKSMSAQLPSSQSFHYIYAIYLIGCTQHPQTHLQDNFNPWWKYTYLKELLSTSLQIPQIGICNLDNTVRWKIRK